MCPIRCMGQYRSHAWGDKVVVWEKAEPYLGAPLRVTCVRCGAVAEWTPSER